MNKDEQFANKYWADHAKKLNRDLSYSLTIKFEDKQMMELFASVLSNSCEQHMYEQALEEYGLRPDFVYSDKNNKWLGDNTIRVFQFEKEQQ